MLKENIINILFKVISVISILFLLLALADMPSEYYINLRYVVSICAVAFIIKELKNRPPWISIFIIIAILYNPIFPIHLHYKPLWTFFNIATAIIFGGMMAIKNDKKTD
jgi:hypothetical protein